MNEVHIPTISGATSTIGFKNTDKTINSDTKVYEAKITGSGAATNPTVLVIKNTMGGTIDITSNVLGITSISSNDGFFLNNKTTLIVSNASPNIIGSANVDLSIFSDDVDLATLLSAVATVGTNTFTAFIQILVNTIIPVVSTTPEQDFNEVLSELDSNQLAMWTKIVVRNGGTTTSVNGKTYRNTGSFNDSYTIINS